MNKIIETSMKSYFKIRQYRVDLWKKSQVPSQNALLRELLHMGQCTRYGKEYCFEDIDTLEMFQEKVPIVSYEQIEPYISRALGGEEDVLWPGITKNFSKSSGTTNDVSKYLPVTHDSLFKNNYKAGKDLYSIFFNLYPHSDLFKNGGSVFSLGGSFETRADGVKVGDVSALLLSELPKWAENYREPSAEIALMDRWQEKIPAMIEDISGKNITHLLGVPTWFVSLFEEMNNRSSYINLRELWPNLELFIHGAVSFAPYRPLFEKLLPFTDMKYMEVYNASEGFFAIADQKDPDAGMLLLTDHGVFYEFIPMDVYGTKDQYAIALSQVIPDVDYAIIITTNAGLWRYDLGDTVRFLSCDPYRICISGRTKHFINIMGEELMVANADQALSEVCKKHGLILEHYTAGPIFMDSSGKGSHEWVIEFQSPPTEMSEFAADLDYQLQQLNSDYAAKRQDDIALQMPVVHSAEKGLFMQWMEQRGKLGGQHKVPRLANTRKYLDQILEIL